MKVFFILTSLVFLQSGVFAQKSSYTYSLLIKHGRVIDPKNKLDAILDVAIQDGKIAAVAPDIDSTLAGTTVNARGMLVTPGLIDLHTHVFGGTESDRGLSNGPEGLPPDGFTFRTCVTTVVDCGSSGWKSFPTFKKNIIDHSRTRVLALLNIVGEGMRGGKYEQDISDMDPHKADSVAKAYKDIVVGFKLAHFAAADWTPVKRVTEAGRLADLPVVIDFGGDDSHPPLSIQELFFKYLRPGDIYTHVFTELTRRDPVVDLKTRKLKPFMMEARKKGILFDVGFGSGSFDFRQALPAVKAGFYPNTMGTDMHIGSVNGAMKDELNILSLFVNLGMSIPDVIKAASWAPAQAIRRPELGNLSIGSEADVALIGITHGNYGFWDISGHRFLGKTRLNCELTVRAGKVVYDTNGISKPIVLTLDQTTYPN